MRIELTIEQLVLAGIPAADADQVRDAIETELSHVLRQADPAAFRSGAVPTVRATMPTTPGAGPTGFGTAVGAILGNTVTGGGGGV
jgi:hypothetical protein